MDEMNITIFGEEYFFEPDNELYFKFENREVLIIIIYDSFYEHYQLQIFKRELQIYYYYPNLDDSQKFVDNYLKEAENID